MLEGFIWIFSCLCITTAENVNKMLISTSMNSSSIVLVQSAWWTSMRVSLLQAVSQQMTSEVATPCILRMNEWMNVATCNFYVTPRLSLRVSGQLWPMWQYICITHAQVVSTYKYVTKCCNLSRVLRAMGVGKRHWGNCDLIICSTHCGLHVHASLVAKAVDLTLALGSFLPWFSLSHFSIAPSIQDFRVSLVLQQLKLWTYFQFLQFGILRLSPHELL